MQYIPEQDNSKLISDLIKEITELTKQFKILKNTIQSTSSERVFSFAFNPIPELDKEYYHQRNQFYTIAHEILTESLINIKSRGYTFMLEAMCIIEDLTGFDIDLSNDVYPEIAKKYTAGSVGAVEHSIRNAINAAYLKSLTEPEIHPFAALCYKEKPTNKKILLQMSREFRERLCNENE